MSQTGPTGPIPWYVVTGRKRGAQGAVSLYDGPHADQAKAARLTAERNPDFTSVRLQVTTRYPPPEGNEKCKCKDAPGRQMLCPFGHPTECHWPRTCDQAACYHLAVVEWQTLGFLRSPGAARPSPGRLYDQTERLRQRTLRAFAVQTTMVDKPGGGPGSFDEQMASWLAQAVRHTDAAFRGGAAAGPCSRCGKPVGGDAVLVWPNPGGYESLYLRYHPACLGVPSREDFA